MPPRPIFLAAVGLAAGAAFVALALLRRRRAAPPEPPPGPEVVDDPMADAPISRETRSGEGLDAEEERRREAAERLEDDNGA